MPRNATPARAPELTPVAKVRSPQQATDEVAAFILGELGRIGAEITAYASLPATWGKLGDLRAVAAGLRELHLVGRDYKREVEAAGPIVERALPREQRFAHSVDGESVDRLVAGVTRRAVEGAVKRAPRKTTAPKRRGAR